MTTERPSRAGMRFATTIGLIFGLLAVEHVLGQSNTPSQAPLRPAPAPAAAPPPDNITAAHDHYVGDEACGSCHREKLDTFYQTSHHLTSRLPDKKSILGDFAPGANTRTTSNSELLFRMDEKEGSFFQTAVQGIPPYTTEPTERFGLVVGSGGKGQTYFFGRGDQLFQLPVSYWTELGWVNSPGYR